MLLDELMRISNSKMKDDVEGAVMSNFDEEIYSKISEEGDGNKGKMVAFDWSTGHV